jgi:putative ABC transport system substrate-binding protein
MMSFTENDPEGQSRLNLIRAELQSLGWREAQNLVIDVRWAVGNTLARQQAVAKELIELRPDLMIVQSTTAVTAVMHESRDMPVVFLQVTDPVGQGLVASLARPGGNITGFSNFEPAIGGKWLQLLKEIAPQLTQVGLMFNPETAPYIRLYLRSLESAASSFSVQIIAMPVRTVAEIEAAIASAGGQAGGGLIVPPDTFTGNHRKLIIDLAARYRLPTVYSYPYQAMDGGLMSYGPNVVEVLRKTMSYVDRILKGEKPGDLPIQQPTKFDLVLNLKTAKALGLEVPLSLQQRANEVIE